MNTSNNLVNSAELAVLGQIKIQIRASYIKPIVVGNRMLIQRPCGISRTVTPKLRNAAHLKTNRNEICECKKMCRGIRAAGIFRADYSFLFFLTTFQVGAFQVFLTTLSIIQLERIVKKNVSLSNSLRDRNQSVWKLQFQTGRTYPLEIVTVASQLHYLVIHFFL